MVLKVEDLLAAEAPAVTRRTRGSASAWSAGRRRPGSPGWCHTPDPDLGDSGEKTPLIHGFFSARRGGLYATEDGDDSRRTWFFRRAG